MSLSASQLEALKAPLNRDHVASRSQGGGQVSYIEGWHAIAEANRIFGFDGWTRETIDMIQLGEPYEKDGKWRVNYRAKVLVIVMDESGIPSIKREGCGFGQGIDRDIGQAHESALKEAETDAMKRALMTFGNPFGLALYDKSHANVQAAPASPPPVITEDQRTELTLLFDQKGIAPAPYLKRAGDAHGVPVNDLRDLPAAEFGPLRQVLLQKPAKAA